MGETGVEGNELGAGGFYACWHWGIKYVTTFKLGYEIENQDYLISLPTYIFAKTKDGRVAGTWSISNYYCGV